MQLYINKDEVDLSGRFPAPLYIQHDSKDCGEFSTAYFDAELRLSLIFKGKEDGSKWKFVNIVKSTN